MSRESSHLRPENIAKLKEAGVIERIGSDKTGSWKVNE